MCQVNSQISTTWGWTFKDIQPPYLVKLAIDTKRAKKYLIKAA